MKIVMNERGIIVTEEYKFIKAVFPFLSYAQFKRAAQIAPNRVESEFCTLCGGPYGEQIGYVTLDRKFIDNQTHFVCETCASTAISTVCNVPRVIIRKGIRRNKKTLRRVL